VPHTVVIGEDHEQVRALIGVLEAEGYDIREAADTQAVLDAVAEIGRIC
jgi:PleD family two-component response regulator